MLGLMEDAAHWRLRVDECAVRSAGMEPQRNPGTGTADADDSGLYARPGFRFAPSGLQLFARSPDSRLIGTEYGVRITGPEREPSPPYSGLSPIIRAA